MSSAETRYKLTKVSYAQIEAHAEVAEFLGMDFEIEVEKEEVRLLYSR